MPPALLGVEHWRADFFFFLNVKSEEKRTDGARKSEEIQFPALPESGRTLESSVISFITNEPHMVTTQTEFILCVGTAVSKKCGPWSSMAGGGGEFETKVRFRLERVRSN